MMNSREETTLDSRARSRETWAAGDYGKISPTLQADADAFMERLEIRAGMRVLDVACGNGNLAIPAARMGAAVTGIDIAPNLVEQARERARQAGLVAEFEEGDAEQLPYPDASFDLVVSMFGVMFAAHPERAAAELIRVCVRGGRIALANWTPQGFAAQLFMAVAKHVPPPPDMAPPILWGDPEIVRERLKDGTRDLATRRLMADIKYPFSPEDTVDYFRDHFGPVRNAFAALSEDQRPALRRDLVDVWASHNRATDGTTRVASEYLEVVATRV